MPARMSRQNDGTPHRCPLDFPKLTHSCHPSLQVPENLTAAVPEILAAFRNGGARESLFDHLVCNCRLERHLRCLDLHRG